MKSTCWWSMLDGGSEREHWNPDSIECDAGVESRVSMTHQASSFDSISIPATTNEQSIIIDTCNARLNFRLSRYILCNFHASCEVFSSLIFIFQTKTLPGMNFCDDYEESILFHSLSMALLVEMNARSIPSWFNSSWWLNSVVWIFLLWVVSIARPATIGNSKRLTCLLYQPLDSIRLSFVEGACLVDSSSQDTDRYSFSFNTSQWVTHSD